VTLQVAYMAPTEILAKQHFESFIKYFEQFPINIGLITGSGCYKFPSKVARNKADIYQLVQESSLALFLLYNIINNFINLRDSNNFYIKRTKGWITDGDRRCFHMGYIIPAT